MTEQKKLTDGQIKALGNIRKPTGVMNIIGGRKIVHCSYDESELEAYIEQLFSEAESRVAYELLADFEKRLKEACEKVRVEAEQKAVERCIEICEAHIAIVESTYEYIDTDAVAEMKKELRQLRKDDKLRGKENDN